MVGDNHQLVERRYSTVVMAHNREVEESASSLCRVGLAVAAEVVRKGCFRPVAGQ